jgi:hypothetical protein
MASVYNYTFENSTRLGDDVCYLSERNKQNTAYGSYGVTNYFSQYCGLAKPIEFATSQPDVFVNGGFGNSGAGGCNINYDSMMKIGTIQTHPKARISLYERPFVTVPYLGRGPSRPIEESKLQQGDFVTNKKSCNTISELEYTNQYTPMIPTLKATISNPNNLVEGVASKGWIRGGLPSRELVRDQDYMQHKKH